MNETGRIAVLMTCFNRVAKTIACLRNLTAQKLPDGWSLQIFLVDDASPDGTGEIVKKEFPDVTVIRGTGSLYWCGGMRRAWSAAKEDFDYYLWLNDDTILFDGALENLLADYAAATASGCDGVITVACLNPATGHFTYGGKDASGNPVEPDGTIRQCRFINGNCVLVPLAVYRKIGGLSDRFTHGIGDFEYGLRALKNGFHCWTTHEYLASCSRNPPATWSNPSTPLFKRFRLLYGVRGLNLMEYLIFLRAYPENKNWFAFFIKMNLRALFPGIYAHLKRAATGKEMD
ncbi:MAG: glycosyltransferase family 2 protein [Victivallaceae bacterium]|nr:glycosyltransferase family 2 protein [Victivallaceae bacterium]